MVNNKTLKFFHVLLGTCRGMDTAVCLLRGGAAGRGGALRGAAGRRREGKRDAEEGRRRRNNRSLPQTAGVFMRTIWTKTRRESTEELMKGKRADSSVDGHLS